MELQKFKLCPECGRHNPPSLLECKFCEADLTGVKIVDSEAESKGDSAQASSFGPMNTITETVLVRICDCGAENPPQARKCSVCGEDISDIMPQSIVAGNQQTFSYDLTSADGAVSFTVDKPLFVVGREAELKDYLAEKEYVSRHHARFTFAAEKVFVENLSKTNKTYVNNEEIPEAIPTALADGDEIGLGGKVIGGSRQNKAAYFIFRVRK